MSYKLPFNIDLKIKLPLLPVAECFAALLPNPAQNGAKFPALDLTEEKAKVVADEINQEEWYGNRDRRKCA